MDFSTQITSDLDLALREAVALYSQNQLFVLADECTVQHCLPLVLQSITVPTSHILTIPQGDQHKSLDTLLHIYRWLEAEGATRRSLLLNVGGGVVTDIGGFAAATFKRGMAFVNIATTLLGAVDAATGGKTGINFDGLKNQIGLIVPAQKVIVCPDFFATLPPRQFLSGYAEMLKHALIASDYDLNLLLAFDIEGYAAHPADYTERLITLLQRSIDIKQYIVAQDMEECSLRRSLNFGHTVGHALEEMALQKGENMPHGYAVAYGMLAELYLSVVRFSFPQPKLSRIVSFVREQYGKPVCACKDYEQLYQWMLHDKKNQRQGEVNFTLLSDVGRVRVDQTASREEIFEALDFLFNL